MNRNKKWLLFIFIFFSLAVLFVLSYSSALALTPYILTDLGEVQPLAINNSGEVVGWSYRDGGFLPFYYTRLGGMTHLSSFGEEHSNAADINDAGEVLINVFSYNGNPAPNERRAYLWTSSGGLSNLGILSTDIDFGASSINDLGHVAGGIYNDATNRATPYLWTPEDGLISIDTLGGDWGYPYDINNNDQVVGTSEITDAQEILGTTEHNAFVWTPDSGTKDLGNLGIAISIANGNNDSGLAVGMSETGEYIAHRAFLWTEDDGMVPLATTDYYRSYSANDINNRGQIVGPASGYGGPFEDDAGNEIDYEPERGLMWYEGVVYDLNDLVIDASGWDYIGPGHAINDLGQIVGVGKLEDIVDENDNVIEVGKRHGYLLTPVWFVKGDAAISGDGTNWEEAFKTIHEAMDVANANHEIWVKQGTYFVTSTIDVDKSVAIYGGFNGTENKRSERNWRTNVTTVDGQNTVTCFYFTADATIDGFTIAHGHTDWGGGGMYNDSCSPLVANCRFSENEAIWGGGIHNDTSFPTITNCIFDGNIARDGAGMHNRESSPTVTNCTFSGNKADSGGGIFNYLSSTPTITNCIFWRDTAITGPEIYDFSSSYPTVTYCDINQDGYVGSNGNIRQAPVFINPANGDIHLQQSSPCIDTGTNDAPELPDTDFEGDPRIVDGNNDGTATMDMGADEYRPLSGGGGGGGEGGGGGGGCFISTSANGSRIAK
jgi:probable HAF family extracellular repeat protein